MDFHRQQTLKPQIHTMKAKLARGIGMISKNEKSYSKVHDHTDPLYRKHESLHFLFSSIKKSLAFVASDTEYVCIPSVTLKIFFVARKCIHRAVLNHAVLFI
jgi:hypothetical protein